MLVECACGKRLKVADHLAGKRVRCPGCGEPLLVEEHVENEQAAAPVKAKRKTPSEPQEEDQPKRPKKKRKPAASFLSRYGLILGLGSGLLAIGAIVAVVLFLNQGGPTNSKDGPLALKPNNASGVTVNGTPADNGVQNVTAQDQTTRTELMQVALMYTNFYSSLQRPPGNRRELFTDLSDSGAPPPVDLSRYGINWGATFTATTNPALQLVAYEREAPTKGGMVIFADLKARKVSAAEFKTFLPLPPAEPATTDAGGAEVRVFMGGQGFGKAWPAPGQPVKFKGTLTDLGIKVKGKVISVSCQLQVYNGPDKGISAAELAKDFIADPTAAKKKYDNRPVVLEGIIAAVAGEGSDIFLR